MYAVIIDAETGRVKNRVRVPSEAYAHERGWVISNDANKGDQYDGSTFTRPPEAVEEQREHDAQARQSVWWDIEEFGSGQDGTPITKLQRAVERSGPFDKIWMPPMTYVDAGNEQLFLKRQSHLYVNGSVIEKTAHGGSIIRSAENGAAPHVHGAILDGGGLNSTPVVFFQGCHGGSVSDTVIRRPSHSALSVMTSPEDDRVNGLKVRNLVIENPQPGCTHLLDINSVTTRARGNWIDIDGLKITGVDPENLPQLPEQYVAGGASPPDVLRIAGMDHVRIRNYRASYGGAAAFSIAVRGSAWVEAENIHANQFWESANVGSGLKLAFVGDPSSIAPAVIEGVTVRKAVRLHNADLTAEPGQMRVDAVVPYADGTYEVRLAAISGEAQFETPSMGQILIPVGESVGNSPAVVQFGRPSALHVDLMNVHLVDTGIKQWMLPDEEKYPFYAFINVINAEKVRVFNSSGRLSENAGGCDRFLSASRANVEVSRCSPSMGEAPEMYEASAGGTVVSLDDRSDGLAVGHGAELEIDQQGWITPTHTHHRIDMDHGLSADDLMGVRTENMRMGDQITFKIMTGTRPVRFRDTGTRLLMPRNITLSHIADSITFEFRGVEDQLDFLRFTPNGTNEVA